MLWPVARRLERLSAPGVTRTPGQRFRKPLLYPPELQGRIVLSPTRDTPSDCLGDSPGGRVQGGQVVGGWESMT